MVSDNIVWNLWFQRIAQSDTLHVKHMICYEQNFLPTSFDTKANRICRTGLLQCHFFLWQFLKCLVYVNKPKQFLSSKWRFNTSTVIWESLNSLSKKEEYARKVTQDIYLIFCSTFNHRTRFIIGIPTYFVMKWKHL